MDIWQNPALPKLLVNARSLWKVPEKSIWMLVIFSLLYKFDEQIHSEFFYYNSIVRYVLLKKISKRRNSKLHFFFMRSREIGCSFFSWKSCFRILRINATDYIDFYGKISHSIVFHKIKFKIAKTPQRFRFIHVHKPWN